MPENSSIASSLASLPDDELRAAIAELSDEEASALIYDWQFWARPNQLPPEGDWYIWLILSGRGWGKTRTGAEYVNYMVRTGQARRIALIAANAADARDVMVEGASGILTISPPWFRPAYEPSKRRVTWPNGAVATTYGGDAPDQLRGPEHDLVWCDELAKFQHPDRTWHNVELGLRIGEHPRAIITTTPKPIQLLRELAADPRTHVTRGATYDNVANLAPATVARLKALYEGTRFARQEIYGEIVDDVEGALWTWSMIEAARATEHPPLVRIVVAVDPAVTAGEDSNETGIIVAGVDRDGNGYVLDDLSLRASPDTWARTAVSAYHSWRADRLAAEVNQGGDLVERVVRTVDASVAYEAVRATRGKWLRAEPVAALYEQHRIHHCRVFEELERQMTTYVPGDDSPDRLDALVWAITALGLVDWGPPDILTAETKRVLSQWE